MYIYTLPLSLRWKTLNVCQRCRFPQQTKPKAPTCKTLTPVYQEILTSFREYFVWTFAAAVARQNIYPRIYRRRFRALQTKQSGQVADANSDPLRLLSIRQLQHCDMPQMIGSKGRVCSSIDGTYVVGGFLTYIPANAKSDTKSLIHCFQADRERGCGGNGCALSLSFSLSLSFALDRCMQQVSPRSDYNLPRNK